MVFSESVTEYYEVPLSEASLEEAPEDGDDGYEEPCRYFWPRNKHFFPRQVWQGLRRYATCEQTWNVSIKQIKSDIGLKCQSWISHQGDKKLIQTNPAQLHTLTKRQLCEGHMTGLYSDKKLDRPGAL